MMWQRHAMEIAYSLGFIMTAGKESRNIYLLSVEFDGGVVRIEQQEEETVIGSYCAYDNTGARVHLLRISSISKAMVATEFELEKVLISKIKLLVETN